MKLPSRPDHHKLAITLAAHFPDHRKNQLELLMLMVFALIQAQTVRHAKLAERFPGTAKLESVISFLAECINLCSTTNPMQENTSGQVGLK